jgi:hypothetical protein
MVDAIDQPGLFPVHDLVTIHGADGAVRHAQDATRSRAASRRGTDLLDALAGRAGRRIADTASASLVREIEGGSRGYSYSAWCLTGLPHRERPVGEDWLIQTDLAQLLIRPGIRVGDNGEREQLAVPSGALARLLLIDWQSQAYLTGNREIELPKTPSALLNKMGMGRGGPLARNLVAQIERLATCSLSFRFGTNARGAVTNERIVEAFTYVGVDDPRTKRPVRMIERVLLSEAYYREFRRHPVLVDRDAVARIQRSPRAIDVYLWLTFRLHALEERTPVSWSALWRQFGTEFKTLKSFKSEFVEPLGLALASYPGARVEQSDRGLVLAPSPPPVAA